MKEVVKSGEELTYEKIKKIIKKERARKKNIKKRKIIYKFKKKW
jgi:predicted nucleic acid-binding Zn ribbon protein